jgi:hypothetical protein
MLLLTEDAVVQCEHKGTVSIEANQTLVTIEGRALLVEPYPAGRSISRCPNVGLTVKPCTNTLKVKAGYSSLLRINGQSVCLDTVEGLTDGTPPGLVLYKVRKAGQEFVAERE